MSILYDLLFLLFFSWGIYRLGHACDSSAMWVIGKVESYFDSRSGKDS